VMSEMQARIEETAGTGPVTVAEYHRMGELGIIGPDERVELLDGKLIPMPPIGPEHAYTIETLNERLVRHFAGRASVRVQLPVALDDRSEPQPDFTLRRRPPSDTLPAHPTPAETLLAVEVSLSSLAFDRGTKLRAYARGGIREYWIVDLVHERVEVYRDPRGERYAVHRTVHRGESVAPAEFPEDSIAVDEILPPPNTSGRGGAGARRSQSRR
jgi:Uma2 family endonuclease